MYKKEDQDCLNYEIMALKKISDGSLLDLNKEALKALHGGFKGVECSVTSSRYVRSVDQYVVCALVGSRVVIGQGGTVAGTVKDLLACAKRHVH